MTLLAIALIILLAFIALVLIPLALRQADAADREDYTYLPPVTDGPLYGTRELTVKPFNDVNATQKWD